MIKIHPDHVDNALGTIRKFGQFIGEIGDLRYYIVDGKLWCHSPLAGKVYRCDNPEEKEETVERIKRLAN